MLLYLELMKLCLGLIFKFFFKIMYLKFLFEKVFVIYVVNIKYIELI